MVRSKQRRKAGEATATVAKRTSVVKNDAAQLTLKDYILLNAVFSGFCILQLVFVRLLLRDFAGLYFFFIFLMVSFLAVSLFDYFSNKLGIGDQIEGSDVPVNEHL